MPEQAGSSPLFAVFFLSVFSLFLIPYTIYKLCVAASPDDVVKPWEAKKVTSLQRFYRRFFTVQNVLLGVGWLAWLALLIFVQAQTADLAPFDPYEILRLERGATERDVKKAYRQLSLIYHPDKNPDPAAATYFAESITKAYKALTDDVARENYEKYGHPDGPQALNLGVALPEWIFSQDRQTAPWILIALVFFCILLPLVGAALFLLRTNKFVGSNQVAQQTIEIFARSKFAVKELQGLSRVLDTLVYAYEFITLPTPSEQAEGLEVLRRTVLRLHPDLKEKQQFWKRRPSIVKCNMLLLAHLGRAEVPPSLQADLRFVLKKAPQLLEEMVTIANWPRTQAMTGWLTPTVGCLEMTQCITQALSTSSRKLLGQGGTKGGADSGVLLQLPHFDYDVVKRMGRKRVRTLAELATMEAEERLDLFVSSGLTQKQAEVAATSLSALPSIAVGDVAARVDGEEEGTTVQENDIVTATVRVTLARGSHALPGASVPKQGAVLAYAPLYPFPKEEKWVFVVGDLLANCVYARTEVPLLEAEAAGLAARQRLPPDVEPGSVNITSGASATKAVSSEKKGSQEGGGRSRGAVPLLANGSSAVTVRDEPDEASASQGQLVEIKFKAPRAGKYDLTLFCISDSWAGVDRAVPFKLRVAEQTRASREGRILAKPKAPEETDAPEDGEDRDPDEEEEEEEEDEGDWDSEDSGTEESGPEDEEEEAKEKVAEKGGEAKADKLEHKGTEAVKVSGAGAEVELPSMP